MFRRNVAAVAQRPRTVTSHSGLVWRWRVQVGETNLWSKDVQRLLWAAGEARTRASKRDHKRPARRRLVELPAPAPDAGFFTEWQPAAH